VFEQRPVLFECPPKVRGSVAAAQPTPRDQVGTRGDRGGGIELHERQLLDHHQQVRRSSGVEHLRPNGDPPRFVATEPAGFLRHRKILGGR